MLNDLIIWATMFGQVMSDGVLSWLASFSWEDVMALPLSSAQIHMHKKDLHNYPPIKHIIKLLDGQKVEKSTKFGFFHL